MMITNYIVFVNEQKVLLQNLKNEKARIVSVLSSSIIMPLISNDKEIALKIVNSITTNKDVVEITIKDLEDVFIHQYFPKRATGKIFTKKQQITIDNNHLGEVILRVSTKQIDKTIFSYLKENFVLFLFQLLFSILFIAVLYYYKISKPVKNLLKLADDIKNEDFTQNYEWKYKDELNQIGKSFEEAKSIISKLIITDSQTGIYNRFMMEKSLNDLSTDQNFSITFFDIDDFKKINDTYGYQQGDKLLHALAVFVSQNIDENDIFGRWSAEEFLIIHPNKSIEEAYAISKNIQESLNYKNLIPALNITCSFGVSSYEKNELLESTLKRCDKALFMAKAQGKNRVVTL